MPDVLNADRKMVYRNAGISAVAAIPLSFIKSCSQLPTNYLFYSEPSEKRKSIASS